MRSPLLGFGGLLSLVLPACFTYPCDRDVLACEQGDAFTIDRACKPDGELVLAVGEGDGEFTPLAGATWPQVHHGVQGGVHFTLGLRLEDVDPDHAEFEIDVEVKDCDDGCSAMRMLSTRSLVVDETYFETDGDALVLADLVLLLEHEPRANGEITVREPPRRTSRHLDEQLLLRPRPAPSAWHRPLPGGCVMQRHERSPVSRVREIRTHGLIGGPTDLHRSGEGR